MSGRRGIRGWVRGRSLGSESKVGETVLEGEKRRRKAWTGSEITCLCVTDRLIDLIDMDNSFPRGTSRARMNVY